jgi:hypothetical protein
MEVTPPEVKVLAGLLLFFLILLSAGLAAVFIPFGLPRLTRRWAAKLAASSRPH